MVNSEALTGTTEYLTLYTRCRINRCRYNRVRLYMRSGWFRGGNKVFYLEEVGKRSLGNVCNHPRDATA
jgi:hypothetical protein